MGACLGCLRGAQPAPEAEGAAAALLAGGGPEPAAAVPPPTPSRSASAARQRSFFLGKRQAEEKRERGDAATVIAACWKGHQARLAAAAATEAEYAKQLRQLALAWERRGVPLAERSRRFQSQGLGASGVKPLAYLRRALAQLEKAGAEVDMMAKVAMVDERNAILANLRTLPTEQRIYLYKMWDVDVKSRNRLKTICFKMLWNPGLGVKNLRRSALFLLANEDAFGEEPAMGATGSAALLWLQLDKAEPLLSPTKSGKKAADEYLSLVSTAVWSSVFSRRTTKGAGAPGSGSRERSARSTDTTPRSTPIKLPSETF